MIKKLKVLLKNIKQSIQAQPQYVVMCPYCGKIQEKAKNWDYQICTQCGECIYDNRNIF